MFLNNHRDIFQFSSLFLQITVHTCWKPLNLSPSCFVSDSSSGMPSVIYALVATGERLLVDHTNPRFTGNFRSTASKLLAKAQRSGQAQATFNLQGHVFSFSRNPNSVWFCAVSDEAYGKQMPFFFLRDLADAFAKEFPDAATASEAGVQTQFGQTLSSKIEQYSNPEDSDGVSRVQAGIDDLRVVLSDNMDLAVKRNQDLNQIADAAENLLGSSESLTRSSRRLRRRLCWADAKLKLIGLALVLFIMYSLAASVCGLSLRSC